MAKQVGPWEVSLDPRPDFESYQEMRPSSAGIIRARRSEPLPQ